MTTMTTMILSHVDAGAGASVGVRAVLDAEVEAEAGAAEQHAEWLQYARWLVAALTFQLGADIVTTSYAPTWDELGRLAVVAVVRTFLSYFLDREMEQAQKLRVAARSGIRPAVPPPGE